ncbi:MAG: hypothetical protein Q9217_002821 [Psora testacea]
MAPSLFSHNNREASAVKYFEIRLDESNLVLRGSEDEASSVLLKGTLVLCLSEPLRVQGIRLRFTGEKRVGWYHIGSGPTQMKHLEEFMRRSWDFKKSAETLPTGNYEWPFDMIIPGQTPESLEGMSETWVIYRMKATIERGMLQQNSVARKQVRVIRTLDPTALELAHAMSVENIWVNKLEYSLSTNSKAVIFGSKIQVEFKLIPLLKGLKIGKITTELFQRQILTIRVSRNNSRSNSKILAVHSDEYHMPEDAETENIEGREGYIFSRAIPVPQSLRKCVQSFDALDIKIRHHLAFNIQLHNPDGHVSELHANLPVFIFLSPNLPIDDNNNLVNGGGQAMAIAAAELTELTPPQYGLHEFDRLYSDIDPSGYMTPAGSHSGAATPLDSRSRSVSVENLASMDALASTDFAASVLQNRLNSLDAAGPVGSHRTARERSQLQSSGDDSLEHNSSLAGTPLPNTSPAGGYFTQQASSSTELTARNTPSRRSSEEGGGQTSPQHIEFSAEDLAKVPSYSTALQSNPRTPISEGLPTYQAAINPSIPGPQPPCPSPPTQSL